MSGTGCAQCFLILVNVLVMIIGLGFIALGVLLMAGSSLITPITEKVFDALPSLKQDAGLSDVTTASSAPAFNVSEVLHIVAIVLLVLGAVLFTMSVLGCCGACMKHQCLLVLYAVIIFLLFSAQLILVILLFIGQLDTVIKQGLNSTITEHYEGIDGTNQYSLSWNFVQVQFNCCGVDNYFDFQSATKWQKERSINGGSTPVTLVTPLTCCKTNGDFSNPQLVDNTCITNPSETNSNYQQGCFNEVRKWGKAYELYIIIGVAVILALQVLVILFSVALICAKRSDDDETGHQSAKQDYTYTYAGHHQSRTPVAHPSGKGRDYYYHQGPDQYGQGYSGYGGPGYDPGYNNRAYAY